MMKKHLIFVLFSSILISNVGVLNFLGFGYRNSNFLIEEVDSYELKDSKSTNYSINLSSYYFKNDIYKNINQNADISRLNSTNIDQARIDIDLYSNKKIMFGVKPLFTSNFSVESKQDNEYNLPDQQTLFYKESYSMDGDVSDYFIGYSYMHRKYKYGFILYYEFGMQTILRKIFTFPSDEKISLASKKMFERKYRSSRVNLFYEYNFNSNNRGLFLLSIHQPIAINQKEYELITNGGTGSMLTENDSESDYFIDQILFKYQYYFSSDKKVSLLLNRINSFKINDPILKVVNLNPKLIGINSYNISSFDISYYHNERIGGISKKNNLILGIGTNYSKLQLKDISFNEFSVKINLGLASASDKLIFNIKYGNRFNNYFSMYKEKFFKISLDLTLGDLYQIK